jgi:uncharacterized SAM-binding protein YcdF (DUF218 family)
MTDILEALVLPSNICFLLTIAGLVLAVTPRTRRAALATLSLAGVLLVVFSCGKTATWLLGPLEYAFPRVPDQPTPVRAIVILAGYATDDAEMSLSDRLNPPTLYRVVEGALLWRQCLDCRVVVSGTSPTTDIMANVLTALGVPQASLKLDNGSVHTAASAINLRPLLGDEPFYLVTSAAHLPRAMAAFAAVHLRPVPAPTDHRQPSSVDKGVWFLSPFHLQASDLAVHERIGAWWYRVRGLS